jgi:diamine N-acetyltransferase
MVRLIEVDRTNARAMVLLELKPEQRSWVSSPGWSLARCYVKFFGDNFEHTPQIIEGDGEIVGFSTIVCDPASETDYWIDDIMIDHRFQGRGYGRAAMLETLRAMTKRYLQCRGVQLTCFRANTVAAKLYLSLGFVPTGAVDDEFGEPTYILKGAALERYRPRSSP